MNCIDFYRKIAAIAFMSFLIFSSSCEKRTESLMPQDLSSDMNDILNKNSARISFLDGRKIQKQFDAYGPFPETKQMKLASGKKLYYTDTKEGEVAVLSIPGSGGDAQDAHLLVNHLRTLREQLGIRVISVEKNGLGSTPYDPNWTAEEYAKNCVELLNRLGIGKVILFSQSAGGLLITHVAERLGNSRVRSIHLGSSASDYDSRDPLNGPYCAMPIEQILDMYAFWTDPTTDFMTLFGPRDVAIIKTMPNGPALVNYSFRNAVRSGSMGWLADELEIGCPGYHVVKNSTAPVYIYHGTNDPMVPYNVYVDKWQYVFPKARIAKKRIYEGEEHLAYFRNFEQVLLDMVGEDDKTIVSLKGQNLVVNEHAVSALLKLGAVRGIAAWAALDGTPK